MISQKARYAFRALITLAKAGPGEALLIAEISERAEIPRKFLEQILLDLKRSGMVASRRGRVGGYLLIKSPDEIFFGDVLRLVDGPVAPLPCLSKIAYRKCDDCKSEEKCEVRKVFGRVAEATRGVLDTTSIASAIDQKSEDISIDYIVA
jgi:Rrf2 family protein